MPKTLTETLPVVVANTTLRNFRDADVEGFLQYRSDTVLAQYQGWEPMTAEDAAAFVKEMADVRHFVSGGWIQLAVACPDSDDIVGDIGIFIDPDNSEAEIGFTLASDHQGKGHATNALEAIEPLLWGLTPVDSIRAITDSRNTSSIRLLERRGFEWVSEYSTLFKGEPCTEFKYVKSRAA